MIKTPYRIVKFASLGTFLVGLAFACMLVNGCGRKAPPVAPSRAPLARVGDLQGRLDKGTVRLTWSHTTENAGAVGYIVLRAQSALSKPQCPDCPQVFQKVDSVPINRSMRRQQHTLELYHDVANGFRYTFNVRAYQSSGGQGPDSNMIVIVNPKD